MREAILKALRSAKGDGGKRKFKQSVELILSFKGIDPKKPQQRISGEVLLPQGCGEPRRICVFAEKELALRAREAGADAVLGMEEATRLASNKKEAKKLAEGFDFFLVQADMMTSIAKLLGKFLGPRGKVPRPLPPTGLPELFAKLRKTVTFRMKDQPTLSVKIGKEDMTEEQLAENAEAVLKSMEPKLPKGLSQVKRAYVKLSMGKPQEVELE
jgi:large subunit ribosomal protein L1